MKNQSLYKLLDLLYSLQNNSKEFHIRVPTVLYGEIINEILHILNIYNTNEIFSFSYHDNDIHFIKTENIYINDKCIPNITKLDIDIIEFYDIIKELCKTNDFNIIYNKFAIETKYTH